MLARCRQSPSTVVNRCVSLVLVDYSDVLTGHGAIQPSITIQWNTEANITSACFPLNDVYEVRVWGLDYAVFVVLVSSKNMRPTRIAT